MAVYPEQLEELTGLELEAEKAYIKATSPRNKPFLEIEDSDAFSWDTEPKECTKDIQNVDAVNSSVLQESTTSEENVPGKTTLSNGLDTNGTPTREQRPTLSPALPSIQMSTSTPHSSPSSTSQEMKLSFATPCHIDSLSTTSTPSTGATPQTNLPSPHIFVVYGPSGLGRGTMVQKMVYRSPQEFALVVSHTTRQARLHETYARDYYFVTKAEMLKKIQEGTFMEYIQINTIDRYQLEKESYSDKRKLPRTSVTHAVPPRQSSVLGDLYGTSWEAFYNAQGTRKPGVVLNVSTKGAEQLKQLEIVGTYILIHEKDYTQDPSIDLEPDYSLCIDSSAAQTFQLLEDCCLSLVRGESIASTTSELEKTKEEWERVPNIELLASGNATSTLVRSLKNKLSQKPITFNELLIHFQNANLSHQLTMIKPESHTSGISKMFGSRRIRKKLRRERDLIFAIALCKFDDHNTHHSQALATIYRRLTGVITSCPRFGEHWEDVGFQGSDPSDDLRGVGILALVQLVWFLETPDTQPAALEMYRYSREGPNHMPFSVVAINVTKICLQALREGCLSRECNRRDQVFAIVNEFYAAVMITFYHNCKKNRPGPMELGVRLQEVAAFSKRYANHLLMELQRYISKANKTNTKTAVDLNSSSNDDSPVNSTPVDNEMIVSQN